MPEHISFRDVNRKKFSDDEHSADYLAAAEYKKVRLGSLALYYKDFWKKYCVPYDYITRAYKGVSVVTPDDHPAIEYFRLILQHEGKEFANIIFGEKDELMVDTIVHRIGEIHPETQLGYAAPEKPAKKAKK